MKNIDIIKRQVIVNGIIFRSEYNRYQYTVIQES